MKFKLFSEYRGLRKELYFLFIGRIMTNLGSMVWPLLTLILSDKIGFNASQIAIYTMIISVAALPLSLLGGKLADKFNKKMIIVICDLISVVGFIYCFFSPINLGAVIVFSISGLFQTIEWPSYDALVADFTTSQDRERAYSLSYLGNNLGLMLAPTLGGLLFKDYLNIAFLINGCAILLSTIFIFFFVKNVSKEVDDSEQAIYEKPIDEKTNVFKYILKNKVLLTYLITSAIGAIVYQMYGYLMPLDMNAIYPEAGAAMYGTMSSINCIIVVIFTPFITRLFKKLFEAKKMIVGECLILLGYILFVSFCELPAFCYIAISIFTLGEIFSTIAGSPFMTKRIPSSHRGRIISVANVFTTILYSVGQIGVGAIYDNFGRYWGWIVVGILAIINISLLVVVLFLDKKYYRNLYYAVEVNGKNVSIKTASLDLINEYYKGFETDPSLYLDQSLFKPYEYSKEKVEEYFNKVTNDPTKKLYVVIVDGCPIGEIILKNINYETKEAELGIHLQNDSVKGKGYGTEAEKLIIRRSFESLGFETIYAKAIVTNIRSQKALEKAGFIKDNEDKDFVYYKVIKN